MGRDVGVGIDVGMVVVVWLHCRGGSGRRCGVDAVGGGGGLGCGVEQIECGKRFGDAAHHVIDCGYFLL